MLPTQLQLKDDLPRLSAWIAVNARSVVFIDGDVGSGKTHVIRQLERNGLSVIDADEFLLPDQSRYVDALKFDELRAAILSKQPPVAIAAVCSRKVAKRLSIDAARFVYLIRISELGVDEFSEAHEAEIHKMYSSDPNIPPPSELGREIIQYHLDEDPAARADVIFRNTVPDSPDVISDELPR
jgi:hypothetical protein